VDFSSTSSGGSADIIAWFWTFGDGDAGFGEDITHEYDETGVYDACLTITTLDSCFDTYCHGVHVDEMSSDCEAYFIVGGISETEDGWIVEFYNESSGDYEGISWSFGDGGTSVDTSPEHLYEETGFYTVCITTGTAGSDCFDEYCQVIFDLP
jgi:PKD repeat protein